LAGEEEDKI